MRSIEVEVQSDTGLHARPAAAFVRAASGFESRVRLKNLTVGSHSVDARSIVGILSAGVEKGHLVRIKAEGEDEELAVAALAGLLMRPRDIAVESAAGQARGHAPRIVAD